MASDLRTLDEIVNFCHAVQERFDIAPRLQRERQVYQKTLIDICRRCEDRTCPEECEVKKAYRATL